MILGENGVLPETASECICRLNPDFDLGNHQMAGVKGRSGGARRNSGGARDGAGRPRKNTETGGISPVPLGDMDMLEMLQKVALGEIEASPLQVRAAIAAVQYIHPKKGEGGKKSDKADAAKEAGKKFSPSPAPPLRAVK